MAAARVGLFGGTFDPIHNGHLELAQVAINQLELDSVLLIPTGESYQKSSVSAAWHRANMVKMAIRDHPEFEFSSIEIDRGGPSFTVDTLARLTETHPDTEYFFIIGEDAYRNLATWKNPDLLRKMVTFAIVPRPGGIDASSEKATIAEKNVWIKNFENQVSSTEIRDLVRNGKPIGDYVPAQVVQYIAENNLYSGEGK